MTLKTRSAVLVHPKAQPTPTRVTAENPLHTAVTQLLIFPGEFGTSQPAQLPTLTSQGVKAGLMAA